MPRLTPFPGPLWLLSLVMAYALSFGLVGCALSPAKAIELGRADSAGDAAANLRSLNDFISTQTSHITDRTTLFHAWRSAAMVSRRHSLKTHSPGEYRRLFASLASVSTDSTLRLRQYEALTELRDPDTIPLFLEEVRARSPADMQEWECVHQALNGLSFMVEDLRDRPEDVQALLVHLPRLLSLKPVVETGTPVTDELFTANHLFLSHFLTPNAVSAALDHAIDHPDPRIPGAVREVLHHMNTLLHHARANDGGSSDEELALMIDTVSRLVTDETETGEYAWKLLMEYAPLHGAMALLPHVQASNSSEALWQRTADTLMLLPLIDAAKTSDREAGSCWMEHTFIVGWFAKPEHRQLWTTKKVEGKFVNPFKCGPRAAMAGLSDRILELGPDVLSKDVGSDLWVQTVHSIASHSEDKLAEVMAGIPMSALPLPREVSQSRAASAYIGTVYSLLKGGESHRVPVGEANQIALRRRLVECAGLPDEHAPLVALEFCDKESIGRLLEILLGAESVQNQGSDPQTKFLEYHRLWVSAKALVAMSVDRTLGSPIVPPRPAAGHMGVIASKITKLNEWQGLRVAGALQVFGKDWLAEFMLEVHAQRAPEDSQVAVIALARMYAENAIEGDGLAERVAEMLFTAAKGGNEDVSLAATRGLLESPSPAAADRIAKLREASPELPRATRFLLEKAESGKGESK